MARACASDDERHASWRRYRNLRSSLLYMAIRGSGPTILVTSAVPGDGKSMTAPIWRLPSRTPGRASWLLDADLRKGLFAPEFWSFRHARLTEVLISRKTRPR